MQFEKNDKPKKIGEITGFFITFLIFSIILFFILKFLGKLPDSWNFFYIIGLAAIINITGLIIKKIIK